MIIRILATVIALNLVVLEKAKYIDPFSSEFTMSSEGLAGLMDHICFMINSRGVGSPLVLLYKVSLLSTMVVSHISRKIWK